MAENLNAAKKSRFYELVVRGINKEYDDAKILRLIKLTYPDITSVNRIKSFKLNKFSSFVKIRMYNDILWKNLLQSGLNFENRILKTELPRPNPTVIRCYNCQALDSHVASECTHPIRCNRCAGEHAERECNVETLKCANCGKSHCASDSKCEIWKRKFEQAKLAQTNATKLDILNINTKLNKIDSTVQSVKSDNVKTAEHLAATINEKCGQISAKIDAQMDHLFELLDPTESPLRKRKKETLRTADSPQPPLDPLQDHSVILPESQEASPVSAASTTPKRTDKPAIKTPTKFPPPNELTLPQPLERQPDSELATDVDAEASSPEPTPKSPTSTNPTSTNGEVAKAATPKLAAADLPEIKCCRLSNPYVNTPNGTQLPCCMDGYCKLIENVVLGKIQLGTMQTHEATDLATNAFDYCGNFPELQKYTIPFVACTLLLSLQHHEERN